MWNLSKFNWQTSGYNFEVYLSRYQGNGAYGNTKKIGIITVKTQIKFINGLI